VKKQTMLKVTCRLHFPFPVPPRKKNHNLPKTPPHQDFLITNVMTQVQIS
jgi:hypothetical protein